MDRESVSNEVDEQLTKCADTLISKQQEYHVDSDQDSDHLENFKRAAQLQRCTPEEALLGMWLKHVISIVDMIKSHGLFPMELWIEKITDAINYLILLRCLIKEHAKLKKPNVLEQDMRHIESMVQRSNDVK